jgi:DNA-directed RNA polymerase subunit RPC12/RpoP
MSNIENYVSETIWEYGKCPLCGKEYNKDNVIDSWWEDGYFYKEYICEHCGAGINEEYRLEYCSTSASNEL